MIDGLILGGAGFASMYLTWRHLPGPLKSLSLRYPLLSDLLAAGLTFTLLTGFSSSLVAVVGAVVAGLLVNLTFVALERWG